MLLPNVCDGTGREPAIAEMGRPVTARAALSHYQYELCLRTPSPSAAFCRRPTEQGTRCRIRDAAAGVVDLNRRSSAAPLITTMRVDISAPSGGSVRARGDHGRVQANSSKKISAAGSLCFIIDSADQELVDAPGDEVSVRQSRCTASR